MQLGFSIFDDLEQQGMIMTTLNVARATCSGDEQLLIHGLLRFTEPHSWGISNLDPSH